MASSKNPFLGDETDDELLAAIQEADRTSAPIAGAEAEAIRYDAATRRFRLTLREGTVLEFDRARLPELNAATDEQLLHGLSLSPSGGAIECRALEMDISTEGLVLDLTMGAGWRLRLRQLGVKELAGSKSPAKAAAARQNGKKGGRPRKAIAEKPASAKADTKRRRTAIG